MKAWMLGLALASCQPQAPPSIFISYKTDGIRVTRSAKARPTGKAMGDISIAALNDFRRQNHSPIEQLCYLDPVERSSFAGTDRLAQLHIEADFKDMPHDPFRQAISTSDGGNFVARIGLAEECLTGAVGAILVIQDVSNGKIANVDMVFTPFLYLWPARDGGWVTISDCVGCDVFDFLVYDAKRRKFTWEGE